MTMPGRPSPGSAARAVSRPLFIARATSVTPGSRAGSIPFNVMNASPRLVLMRAFPMIAGAAPVTWGTVRNAADSAW
jgi:hypothetical protein